MSHCIELTGTWLNSRVKPSETVNYGRNRVIRIATAEYILKQL